MPSDVLRPVAADWCRRRSRRVARAGFRPGNAAATTPAPVGGYRPQNVGRHHSAGELSHHNRMGGPALALDLCEELRAPVADSTVIRALNNGELGRAEFQVNLDGVTLTERGRKALISAYERRVSGE